MKNLKYHFEYFCSPIWVLESNTSNPIYQNTEVAHLSISVNLRNEISDLQKIYQSTYNEEYPPEPAGLSKEEDLIFTGRVLRSYELLVIELSGKYNLIFDKLYWENKLSKLENTNSKNDGTIRNFEFCAKDGLFFEPNVTGNTRDNLFANISDESYRRFNNSSEAGVAWLNQERKIIFLEKGIRIFGLPSPNMKKAVLIYPRQHPKFMFPRNGVIYNPDSTVYLRLAEPVLISEISKERKKNMNYGTPDWLWYDHVNWSKDDTGKLIMCIRIGFDRDWYEERILNLENGELGECVGSGRF